MKNLMCANYLEKEAPVEPNSFGLARVYEEGCAMHPDDLDIPDSWTEEQERGWYTRQLAAWKRDKGTSNV